MGKNNKGAAAPSKPQDTKAAPVKSNSAKEAEDKNKKKPAVGVTSTGAQQQKKAETKEKPKAASLIPENSGVIEQADAEIVDTLQTMLMRPFEAKSIYDMKFDASNRMTPDGQALLLSCAERFFSRRDPNNHTTVIANQFLEMNIVYNMARITVQNWQEGVASGLRLPPAQVQEAIDSFNAFGLALKPGEVGPDGQQSLVFDKDASDAETVKEIAAENAREQKVIRKEVVIVDDPDKWENNEEATTNILLMMGRSGKDHSSGKNLYEIIEASKKYLTRIADAKKTELYGDYTIGDWFNELLKIVGKKRAIFSRGLSASTVSSMKFLHHPIFSHCTVRLAIPQYTEEETRDLIKGFIVAQNEDSGVPLDQDLAVKNGITGVTREQLLAIASELGEPTIDARTWTKIKEVYKDVLGNPTDPAYVRNMANKMIEITNLYLDKDAALAPYEEKEYPAAYEAVVKTLTEAEDKTKETSKEEKPKEDPKPDPKQDAPKQEESSDKKKEDKK